MKIDIYPEDAKRDKCLLLVGGSGDTAERFEPLAKLLSFRIPGYAVATFSLSNEVKKGENLLETQASELREVMNQLVSMGKFKTFIIWCTSMGGYAAVKLLVDIKYSNLFERVIFFDPADYYLSSRFGSTDGELTWSGYMEYKPDEPLVSGLLKDYRGGAIIDVVHLTLRNHGSNGYLEEKFEDRGKDNHEGYPRLNTEMVKKFYENTLVANRGEYLEVNNIPHGSIRDGDIEENLIKVADLVAKLLQERGTKL